MNKSNGVEKTKSYLLRTEIRPNTFTRFNNQNEPIGVIVSCLMTIVST